MSKQVQITATNTNRVTEALQAAAHFHYEMKQIHCKPRDGRTSCHSFRDEFFCQGYHFKSRKAFNEWMVAEINTWMGDNGLVDWDILDKAHSTHGSSFKLFAITE